MQRSPTADSSRDEAPDPRAQFLSLTDAQLEAQCDRDHYRASGPGGQHRNKTDSAVRLRHRPTGLVVTATERRSQAENRARAIRRLREAIAFDWRVPLKGDAIPPVVAAVCSQGRIQLATKHANYISVAAYLLDLLDHRSGKVSTVAEFLGVSTASVVKFLSGHEDAWQSLQQIRQRHSLGPLRSH